MGNKVAGPTDEAFLREHLGDALIGLVGVSDHVKAAEQGAGRPIAELEPATRAALAAIRPTLAATERDWARYTRQAVHFHLRNADAWANARTGEDLSAQVDPEFVLGPAALATVG